MRIGIGLLLLFFLVPTKSFGEGFYPGCYRSSDVSGKSLPFRIGRWGMIRDLFDLQLPQGQWVSIQFPSPIRWDSESQLHLAYGSFTTTLSHDGKKYQCRYPIKLEANFIPGGEEVDITLTFSQRYYVSPHLRCLSEGEAQTFYMFYRSACFR